MHVVFIYSINCSNLIVSGRFIDLHKKYPVSVAAYFLYADAIVNTVVCIYIYLIQCYQNCAAFTYYFKHVTFTSDWFGLLPLPRVNNEMKIS